MKKCKVCKEKFQPLRSRQITCGKQICIRKNSGAYVKKEVNLIDHKGFESLVRRVRSSLSAVPDVTVIYVKGVGFKVFKSIKESMAELIESGEAIKVNNYTKSVPTEYLIEDFVFMTDQIAAGELK
jgi:hypothetical protein